MSGSGNDSTSSEKEKKENCIFFLENTSQELCSKLDGKFVKIQNAIDKKYQIKRLD